MRSLRESHRCSNRVSVHKKKLTLKHFKVSGSLIFNTSVNKLINVNPEVRIDQGFQFSHDYSHQLGINTRGALLFKMTCESGKHAWCFYCLNMTFERCKHELEMSSSFCHSRNLLSQVIILHLPLLDTSPRNNSMLEKLVNCKLNCSKSRQTWTRNSFLS